MLLKPLIGHYKKKLHAKKDTLIAEALKEFQENHGFDSEDERVRKLKEKLEAEAIRVYNMVDESILKERFKRAEKTFAITAVAMFFLTFLLVGFASPLAMLLPFVAAGVTAYASIDTVDISYNQRVVGAFKSVTAVYEEELSKAKGKSESIPTLEVSSSPPPVREENKAGGFVERLKKERNRFIPFSVSETATA